MKTKQCTKCGEVKPLTEFHKDKRRPEGYGSWCKECVNAHTAAWYADNRDRKAATGHKYYAENRERKAATVREWQVANPEKVRAGVRRRRAHKAGADGSFTEAEFKALIKQVGGRCPCCGRKFGLFLRPTRDHIVPLSQGGSDDISNIQPLCSRCNDRKGTKTIRYIP